MIDEIKVGDIKAGDIIIWRAWGQQRERAGVVSRIGKFVIEVRCDRGQYSLISPLDVIRVEEHAP